MRGVPTATILVGAAIWLAPPTWGAPDGCASLGGVVQGNSCSVQADEPSYTMNVNFPLDYPNGQAIIEYLSQTREGFLNVVNTPDSRNLPYEMDVTAESLRSARTRSVVLTLFQNVGAAHPTTWYKTFTYDVERGRTVTFDTLFAPDADPLAAIFPIVQSKLQADTGLADSISPADGRDPSRYQNFAITDESVIFYFGRAEMLPSYAGAVSVEVPRSAIPPLQV